MAIVPGDFEFCLSYARSLPAPTAARVAETAAALAGWVGMDMVTIVGSVGAVASVASFAPQAAKIIRARNTDGLSGPMYGLTCLSFACWSLFGILKGEWTMIVPNLLCLALAAFIFVLILLPPAKTAAVAEKVDPAL